MEILKRNTREDLEFNEQKIERLDEVLMNISEELKETSDKYRKGVFLDGDELMVIGKRLINLHEQYRQARHRIEMCKMYLDLIERGDKLEAEKSS